MVFSAAGATWDGSKLGYVLNVGGGSGQLPPGRWEFAVVAENANSQVCFGCCVMQVVSGVLQALLREW